MSSPSPSRAKGAPRGLLETAGDKLTPFERAQIRFVRRSFDSKRLDTTIRYLQRAVGARWILTATRNLRHVYGAERLPAFSPDKSFLCVSNHRSFFDLYVVMAELFDRGLPHRILFPVRSNFWYDHPLGPLVNGIMSFWAMYPPLFRDPARGVCNLASLDEMTVLMQQGGHFLGLHPEGTRNKGGDPYTFLPAQSGVGRIIHRSKVTVLPVFVNGLTNDIVHQVVSNETKAGTPITVVFGKPIDFGPLLDAPESPRVYRKIAEKTLEVIGELGEEERGYRALLSPPHAR